MLLKLSAGGTAPSREALMEGSTLLEWLINDSEEDAQKFRRSQTGEDKIHFMDDDDEAEAWKGDTGTKGIKDELDKLMRKSMGEGSNQCYEEMAALKKVRELYEGMAAALGMPIEQAAEAPAPSALDPAHFKPGAKRSTVDIATELMDAPLIDNNSLRQLLHDEIRKAHDLESNKNAPAQQILYYSERRIADLIEALDYFANDGKRSGRNPVIYAERGNTANRDKIIIQKTLLPIISLIAQSVEESIKEIEEGDSSIPYNKQAQKELLPKQRQILDALKIDIPALAQELAASLNIQLDGAKRAMG